MKVKLVIMMIVFFGLFCTGCEKLTNLFGVKKEIPKEEPLAKKGTLVAKVNQMSITLEELNREVENFNNLVAEDRPQEKIDTKEKKLDYLKNEMIRRLLLYQEALDRGLDKKEDIIGSLENLKISLLVSELVREETEKVTVSSQDIENFYNQYKEQFRQPEERKLSEIVAASEEEAKAVLIELLRGGDFASLARQYSKAESAKRGGDLGLLKRGDRGELFSSIDEVAFSDSLGVGNVSHIFKGPEGYYILKLQEKKVGKERSLSEVWDDIKNYLQFFKQQQRIDELVGKLTREAKLEIQEGLVK